jgi:hypothetical protein
VYENVRYRYAKTDVAVPATWLMARLDKAPNIALRVRKTAERAKREKRKQERLEEAARLARAREKQERERLLEAARLVSAPAPDAPDTLGWRGWRWNGQVLISPVQQIEWHDTTLRVEQWSDSTVVRGFAGIHARRLPHDWRKADPSVTEIGCCDVHGIVERFGRYVLGTEGWRAEWVVIRELMAPNAKTALALMQRYPDVRVHVKQKGDEQ